jgi:hypothetical protein
MKPNRPPAWLIPLVAGVVILSPCAYSVGHFAWTRMFAAPKPFLEVLPVTSQRCVRDPGWMRQNHRVFLYELRDKAVRDGIRNEVTLSSCSQCHKDKTRFCDKCHNATNLHPDCFDCHSYSKSSQVVALLNGGP